MLSGMISAALRVPIPEQNLALEKCLNIMKHKLLELSASHEVSIALKFKVYRHTSFRWPILNTTTFSSMRA